MQPSIDSHRFLVYLSNYSEFIWSLNVCGFINYKPWSCFLCTATPQRWNRQYTGTSGSSDLGSFFVVFFCLQSPLYIQLIFNLKIKHSSSHYYHCGHNTINFLFQEKKKYIRAFIQLGPKWQDQDIQSLISSKEHVVLDSDKRSLLIAMFHLRRLLEDPEPKPVQIATGEPRPERPFSTPENEPHWYKSTHEPEPNTIMPEIMTNQEAFLMYGIFIFALTVFCVVLLIMFIYLKQQ